MTRLMSIVALSACLLSAQAPQKAPAAVALQAALDEWRASIEQEAAWCRVEDCSVLFEHRCHRRRLVCRMDVLADNQARFMD